MIYDFELYLSEVPDAFADTLPLAQMAVDQGTSDRNAVCLNFLLEFDVREDVYTDEYIHIEDAKVIFVGLTLNDKKVPEEFWDALIPEDAEEDIMELGPGEFAP